jgi:alpha-mannosidase
MPQLSAPLEWRRWADRGAFWDAWDLADNYRDHPLPLAWQPGPVLAEQGPLCCRLVWRGHCGASRLRLDLQLRAGTPWLELTLSIDWRQCHELLRLELPLAQPAQRWAADTSGGVLERPARTHTAREASRWEVPAISWVASQAASGGLALLLDGPQGVSASPERLGVSLLRAPTWPDPGADNGPQRLRVALCPCMGGWRQAAVPAAAVRFREPLWLRPAPGPMPVERASGPSPWLPVLDLGDTDLQLVSLRPDPQPAVLQLTVHNLSPCRRQLVLNEPWEVIERLDYSANERAGNGITRLGPWQLVSWRIQVQSSWSSNGSVSPFDGGPKAR